MNFKVDFFPPLSTWHQSLRWQISFLSFSGGDKLFLFTLILRIGYFGELSYIGIFIMNAQIALALGFVFCLLYLKRIQKSSAMSPALSEYSWSEDSFSLLCTI